MRRFDSVTLTCYGEVARLGGVANRCRESGEGTMAKGGLIHFICIADAHATRESKSSSDTLTVVSNQWAYCAFDARSDGHQWQETEGVTFEQLRSGLTRSRLSKLPAEDRSR